MSSDMIFSMELPPEIFLTQTIFPKRVNLIYGRNGTGKTTMAQLFRDTDRLVFGEGTPQGNDLMIFDRQFVSDNIRRYANMPGIVTVSADNAEYVLEAERLRARLHECEGAITRVNSALESTENENAALTDDLKEHCWEKTRELRRQFEKAVKDKRTKQKLAEALFVTEPQAHDTAKLAELYQAAFVSDLKMHRMYGTIPDTMVLDGMSGAELLSAPILGSGDSVFSEFMKKIRAADWVKSGHENFSHAAGNACPYCQQMLPDDFGEQLAACFDEEYRRSLDSVRNFLERYRRAANDMFIPLQNDLKEGERFENADHKTLLTLMKLLKRLISTNIERIRGKTENPSLPVTLEPTHELMEQINAEIYIINSAIGENNRTFGNLAKVQEECRKKVTEYITAFLQNDINKYCMRSEQLEQQRQELIRELNGLLNERNSISEQMMRLMDSISDTSAAVSQINELLSQAGFGGFSLRQSRRYDHTYEAVRENGQIVSALSEGEQNFLAFLYYYHLLGSELKEKSARIAVIDDPFTGLDRESADIVLDLLKKLIRSCTDGSSKTAQLFIMTHRRDCCCRLADGAGDDDGSVLWTLTKTNGRSLAKQETWIELPELDDTGGIF